MESSVQDNPAAPPPCQYTLKALLNSVLGKQSSTQFAQHFLNRLVWSRPVSTSTAMSDCFQPGQAKVMPGPTPLVTTSLCQRDFGQTNEQQRHLNEQPVNELHGKVDSNQTSFYPPAVTECRLCLSAKGTTAKKMCGPRLIYSLHENRFICTWGRNFSSIDTNKEFITHTLAVSQI